MPAFADKKQNKKFVSICLDKEKPADETKVRLTDISIAEMKITNPVYVDLLNGNIYEIPKEKYVISSSGINFLQIPIKDYPVLISDYSMVISN